MEINNCFFGSAGGRTNEVRAEDENRSGKLNFSLTHSLMELSPS
jgi:hypothetical protein